MESDNQGGQNLMAGAGERHMRSGLGITAKVFLSTAGVVAAAIGAAVWWTSMRADKLMQQGVRDAFASTEYVFRNIQEARYDKLKRLNGLVAQDPSFRAVILTNDEATYRDDIKLRQQQVGADLVFYTDAEGKLLVRSDGQGRAGTDLSGWPLLEKAIKGEPASGLMAEGGRLFHGLALPVGIEGEGLAGVLVSGYALDDHLADEMKRTTGTEVAFVSLTDGKPALSASTLKKPEEVAPLLSFVAGSLQGGAREPERIDVAGQAYIALASPLETTSGQRAGSLLALRSIAAELQNFRKLRSSILTVGAVALLLAFLVSFLLASRMTGPLRRLSAVAQAVTDGKYDVQVPEYGGDEVGALASAVRSMVRELKEKQELEKYVAELSDRANMTLNIGANVAATVAGAASTQTAVSAAATQTVAGGGEPQIGAVFAGRYEVLEVIGHGGMGKVYKVRDRDLDEMVALKTIRKDVLGSNPEVAERFKLEIKLARKATHKNILRTFDFGDAGGVQYLTMEYVKGYTLRELIRKQKDMPLGIALRIAKQVCTGLYAAHDAGIIHRDVKSQNILIQPSGELKIMDFGIARPAEQSNLTSTGAVVGTPEFISPEQAMGKEADVRSDIYSAGMVFYELFTGTLPFRGGPALEIMMRHVQEAPKPPRQLNPALPVELERIILRMAEKDPGKRFASFAEVYGALTHVPLPETAAKSA